ncbi:MAG: tyrosine-protein kinase family protein [Pirellulaceae bacterium]
MNALDQAFIKAFAKNHPVRTTEGAPPTTGAKVQPPVCGVDSMSLVIRDLGTQGNHFRVDRPTCAETVLLAPHLIMPAVAHVESYEPAEIFSPTPPQVMVDDPTRALSEILSQPEAPTSSRAARSTKAPVADVAKPDAPPVERASALEERLELLVGPDLRMPDLTTRAFGSFAEDRDSWAGRSTTEIDIGWHDVDLDRLIADVPCRRQEKVAVDETAHGVAPAVISVSAEELGVGDRRLTEAEEAALLQGLDQPALKPFTPAWEVDAFHWPEICTQLDEASGHKLTQSGDELNVATQDGLKVIAIVSTQREEGRTTLALSLARMAAAAGSRVALVDYDGASPELARQLGLESPCDWREIVRQGQSLSQAAVASLGDRVTLLPLTISTDALSGRLDDPLLIDVLQELKQHFDLVVVDTQPLVAESVGASAVPLPCAVDMAVLVRNVQTTTQDECLSSVARLRAMGVRAVGIVENFAPAVEDCEVSRV